MNNLFIQSLFSDQEYFFSVLLIVVFSVCCHEFMHAAVALWCGDDTAARNGHLTFNPLKQMGGFSLLLLAVLGIAWGQVPVNPANFRRKYDDLLVSLAGPFTNFLLALVSWGLFLLAYRMGWRELVVEFFFLGALMNLILFLFNLLPVPPLDGFAILRVFCPRLMQTNSEWIKGGFLLLGVMVFFGFRYLWGFVTMVLLTVTRWVLG